MPQVEVTFDIDANGILHVSAKDRATNKEQKIRIEASSGLSESEIDKMVKDAESHASEDRGRKEKIEARNQLDSLIYQGGCVPRVRRWIGRELRELALFQGSALDMRHCLPTAETCRCRDASQHAVCLAPAEVPAAADDDHGGWRIAVKASHDGIAAPDVHDGSRFDGAERAPEGAERERRILRVPFGADGCRRPGQVVTPGDASPLRVALKRFVSSRQPEGHVADCPAARAVEARMQCAVGARGRIGDYEWNAGIWRDHRRPCPRLVADLDHADAAAEPAPLAERLHTDGVASASVDSGSVEWTTELAIRSSCAERDSAFGGPGFIRQAGRIAAGPEGADPRQRIEQTVSPATTRVATLQMECLCQRGPGGSSHARRVLG
jgi:hypothetical protein